MTATWSEQRWSMDFVSDGAANARFGESVGDDLHPRMLALVVDTCPGAGWSRIITS